MDVLEFAKLWDLTLWSTSYIKDTQEYHFMDNYGINVIIDPNTKEFCFKWLIPNSIFTIECPKCSPYDNIMHFRKMYRKFRKTISTYKDGLSIDCEENL